MEMFIERIFPNHFVEKDLTGKLDQIRLVQQTRTIGQNDKLEMNSPSRTDRQSDRGETSFKIQLEAKGRKIFVCFVLGFSRIE